MENNNANGTAIYFVTIKLYKDFFNRGLITKEELNLINEDLKAKYAPRFDVLMLDYKAV